MKQIDKIINQCRTAIHAGVPILYIESDDIGIIDDILRTEKLTKYWSLNTDGQWEHSTECRPDNIFVRNKSLDLGFNWGVNGNGGAGPKTNTSYDQNSFKLPDSDVVMRVKEPIRFILAVRNFNAESPGGFNEVAERVMVKHVSDVVSSRPDDNIRKCVIMLQSPYVSIPRGIEPYVELIEVPKLEDDEIRDIIIDFAKEKGEKPYEALLQPLVVNLRGFNPRKIKDVLNRIYLHCQGLFNIKSEEEGIKMIRSVKEQMLKKEGLLKLKYVDRNAQVSGLDNLTDWLDSRVDLFKDPIKAETQCNLSTPKGILVSGIPGTGKSALANQIGLVFDLPILQFDMGSVLGKYSGESEANMRRVLKLAESMAPCVLWIDEIEKAFSSASSSGDADGGQGKRLFGQFLTWMQEKQEACFIFATANDISALPPEFLRRGRFDQKFFTFMPTKQDSIEIFKGIFRRFNGKSKTFRNILADNNWLTSRLSDLMEYCGKNGKFVTGADVEGIVKDAMFSYYQKFWKGKIDTPQPYVPDIFFTELRHAIDNVQTYGETNMKRIVECLFKLAENQFFPASGSDNLISLKDVDFRNAVLPDFKGKPNGYDEVLHAKIKDEVDFIRKAKGLDKNKY